ncbi:addiction module toxin, HicA family protein [Spirochaetia bacterium]|nr:addiction module toxin, HicA family protein [Spirochaetia bacterium]
MGKVYRVDEIIKILVDDGWKFDSQESSHRNYEHPIKKGKVTVPMGNKELAKKTANSILKQAGLK